MNEVIENESKASLAQSDAAALAELDAPLAVETPPAEVKTETTEAPPALADAQEPPAKPEDAIAPRPHARQETHKDFDALKAIIKTEREQREGSEKKAKELEEKLTSLETEYKGKILTPEMETEFKELKELRREYQLENDPEFRQEWDGKLQEVNKRALGILVSCDLADNLQKFIIDNGGIITMYNSSKLVPEGTHTGQSAGETFRDFIEEVLMTRLPEIQKIRLQQEIVRGINLREDMSQAIEQAKTQGSERQKQKQQELQDKFNESVTATREQLGELAKKLDYPKDATKEQKAKVDKHNSLVDKAEKAFNEYLTQGVKDPSKVAEAFTRASASFALMDKLTDKDVEIADRDAKIKELEEKLNKIKESGSTGRTTSAPPPSTIKQAGKFMTDAEALAQAFPGR